jgi:ATP/ADP translocase
VALGFMNMFSLLLAKQFNLSKRMRFLAISLLAPSVVLIYVYLMKVYNYTTQEQWFEHIWKLYLFYFITFNVVVYLLDRFI